MFSRCLICLSGPFLAGAFALLTYTIYGNVNWGTPLFNQAPWVEPVFWVFMLSGVVWLALTPVCKWMGGRCAKLLRKNRMSDQGRHGHSVHMD